MTLSRELLNGCQVKFTAEKGCEVDPSRVNGRAANISFAPRGSESVNVDHSVVVVVSQPKTIGLLSLKKINFDPTAVAEGSKQGSFPGACPSNYASRNIELLEDGYRERRATTRGGLATVDVVNGNIPKNCEPRSHQRDGTSAP